MVVARKVGIPKKGKAVAISDQILLAFLSPWYRPRDIAQNNAIIVMSMRLMTFKLA